MRRHQRPPPERYRLFPPQRSDRPSASWLAPHPAAPGKDAVASVSLLGWRGLYRESRQSLLSWSAPWASASPSYIDSLAAPKPSASLETSAPQPVVDSGPTTAAASLPEGTHHQLNRLWAILRTDFQNDSVSHTTPSVFVLSLSDPPLPAAREEALAKGVGFGIIWILSREGDGPGYDVPPTVDAVGPSVAYCVDRVAQRLGHPGLEEPRFQAPAAQGVAQGLGVNRIPVRRGLVGSTHDTRAWPRNRRMSFSCAWERMRGSVLSGRMRCVGCVPSQSWASSKEQCRRTSTMR